LMGGLIQLLEISGCLDGFSEWLQKIIKLRRQSLLATFALGVVVFIDDYLNCLAVSSVLSNASLLNSALSNAALLNTNTHALLQFSFMLLDDWN
ncbi:hypothetical protein R0K04_21695, partial [Pseudoalteromonas sp. SIMBA_153]